MIALSVAVAAYLTALAGLIFISGNRRLFCCYTAAKAAVSGGFLAVALLAFAVGGRRLGGRFSGRALQPLHLRFIDPGMPAQGGALAFGGDDGAGVGSGCFHGVLLSFYNYIVVYLYYNYIEYSVY